jgi:DNA modification methylase
VIRGSTKTRNELITLCKENNIKGYSSKNKEDITKLLIDFLANNKTPVKKNKEEEPLPLLSSIEYIVGNALELLEEDTKTYKCIYLDPPYASGRDYKFADKDDDIAFTDKIISGEYKDWLSKLIRLCKNRLSKDGTLWFHIAAEYSFIPEQILHNEFKIIEKNFWKK